MYRLTKLNNGLNLITVPIKGTKAVTIMALFPVGSRYESKKISGASHFVEHLLFDGTLKRPSSLDISRVLDAEGADYNAFTFKDFTGYYVKINSAKQELAFDLLSDMIFHSQLTAKEIVKEKGVIVEELRMYEDNPTMAVDLLFDQVMFGDHPLGRDIGGTIETVRNMTRQDLLAYYRQYYIPQNMVLVVAGHLAPKKEMSRLLRYFTQEDRGKMAGKNLVSGFQKYVWPKDKKLSERLAVKEKKFDQAHLILGWPGLGYSDKDRFAAAILTNILGIGMSSRLFVEVREKRGLAYMIRCGLFFYRETGVFQIQAGLDPARLEEALRVIRVEIKKIVEMPVTAKELSQAKSAIIGRMVLGGEDSSTLADWFAKQFWFDSRLNTYEQIFKKIKSVTIEDVLKQAKRLFKMSEMRLAVIGPVKKAAVLKMLK